MRRNVDIGAPGGTRVDPSGSERAAGSPERVLVTGSAGALGALLVRELPDRGFAVRGLDVARPSGPTGEFVQASVTDLEAVRAACSGVSAIVHLGGAASPDAGWADCLGANIDGTRTVLEAARLEGVDRVAIASSNHALGFTPRTASNLPADAAVRPDSFYGVSKAAAEALASYYADAHGLRIVSLRIGSCFPEPTSTRMLATWLSPADFVRLIVATLTGRWEGHLRVWGVSRNTRRWWSLQEGARIGFDPEDDAEAFASVVTASDDRYLGGIAPSA
jgi:uronate dehydrogenase